MLSASDIHFSYGETEVLCGITMQVRPGEVLSILGLNGAGKSTLLRVLAGALTPGRGEVRLQEKPLATIPSRERAKLLAMVPQEAHIPFPFTALEIVLMGRTPHLPRLGFESRRDIAAAMQAMEATDCRHLAGRDLNTLSGGERRRVIIARALAQEARWLLLDEPMSFLDVRHATELARLIRRLIVERGIGVAMVMHDLNLAAAASDRIVMLRDGAIAAQGAPREVISTATILDVFGTAITVGTDPRSGIPYCVPDLHTRFV